MNETVTSTNKVKSFLYDFQRDCKNVAKYLATLSLNKTNWELFDWIEVGEEYSGIKYCVYSCV